MKTTIRIIILYILTITILKLFSFINTSWLLLLSPFTFVLSTFIMYLLIMLVTSFSFSYIQKKKAKKHQEETETSFHCNKCAKPFKKPLRHFKGELVICKNCTKKHFKDEE